MSKLLKFFIGIDFSKTWFDVALIKGDHPTESMHHQFSQSADGFKKMVIWLQQLGVLLNTETLFCMEYTGIYNAGLANFLIEQKAQVWVEMPLRIKRSTGFERGSDDKTCAL